MDKAFRDDYFIGIPLKIKVGPFMVDVKIVDRVDEQDSLGQYCADKSEIQLRSKHVSRIHAADTVLHEVMHAIYRTFALDKNEEEQIVSAMATGLVQVLVENQLLRAWIMKMAKDGENGRTRKRRSRS